LLPLIILSAVPQIAKVSHRELFSVPNWNCLKQTETSLRLMCMIKSLFLANAKRGIGILQSLSLAAALAWPAASALGGDTTTHDTVVGSVASSVPSLPPALQNYDPTGQIRFHTAAEAEARRQTLIHFIWPNGLPTNAQPAAATNIGAAVFTGDLSGLDGAFAASVDRLDANVSPFEFHGISYLVHPLAANRNNRRLVIVNSGHRADGAFAYGVNDAANRLLREGFNVLMTDMPLVGFNKHNTISLPDGHGIVTIAGRGTTGHNEMFRKLTPKELPDGIIFRFFLEPMVQGANYFLRTTPVAADISYVGLSGGGWTGHLLAALDTRIKKSFPVAGSFPLYVRDAVRTSDDAEQTYAPLYLEICKHNTNGLPDTAAGVASWLEIYALGGIGAGREQVQILNLYDACCFSGSAFVTYTNFVATTVRNLGPGEWRFHSDATHHSHQISSDVLNQVILPDLLGRRP
jgi:hypothetical protein